MRSDCFTHHKPHARPILPSRRLCSLSSCRLSRPHLLSSVSASQNGRRGYRVQKTPGELGSLLQFHLFVLHSRIPLLEGLPEFTPLSTRVHTCNNTWVPRGDHFICCCFTVS